MNIRQLMRLAHMARNPPGRRQRIMIAVVLAAVGVLWGIEALFGWPEWATVNRQR